MVIYIDNYKYEIKQNLNIINFLHENRNYNLGKYLNSITETIGIYADEYGNRLVSDGYIENYKNKSFNRLYNILDRISKINGSNKVYQVRGYYEYKIIKKYCDINNIRNELIVSDTLVTNKVIKIKQYVYGDGDGIHHKGFSKKVQCLYVKIYK